jgi:predicted nucleic acid-binding protein
VIIFDTNVVSEIMRPQPDKAVLAWLENLAPQDPAITTVTIGEILSGIAILPVGRRRSQLETSWSALLESVFEWRIYSFDMASAERLADVVAICRRRGTPINLADAQIAATALAHNHTPLATRDSDFAGLGLAVVNPWTSAL